MWLKNNDQATVAAELSLLQKRVKELSEFINSVNIKDLFRNRGTIKAFVIALGLFTGQHPSGFAVVVSS